ncbi:hypothetical protein BGX26_000225 [Mortierella sp. AD094]|nr:hypothetical protein BGX26_000225 [Mortierella sp. AD094]
MTFYSAFLSAENGAKHSSICYSEISSFHFRWKFTEESWWSELIVPQVVVEQRNEQMIGFLRRHHSTLEEITIEEADHGLPAGLWELLAEENSFPKLTTLDITEATYSEEVKSAAFWKTCAKVQKLEINGHQWDVPSDPQAWLEFNRLEDLTLHKTEGHHISQQVGLLPLLAKTPRLKSLKWVLHRWYISCDCGDCREMINDADDPEAGTCNIQIIEGLADLASSARLPYLGSLNLTMHPYKEPIQPVRDILSAAFAKLLSNLTAPLIQLHLLDFDTDPHLTFPSMQRHFATLKSLDISLIPSDSSHMVQAVLASCPSLESFSGNVIRAVDMMEGAPWVCSRLEKLALMFVIDPNEKAPGKTTEDQCRIVYTHLSGLSSLRFLDYYGRRSTLEDTKFVSRTTAALLNPPRYNNDLTFRPLIQGVRVIGSHFWNSDIPVLQGFEQNYDWYIKRCKE